MMQQPVMEHARGSACSVGVQTAGVNTPEALRKLRAPSFYASNGGARLGNYDPDLLALPSVGSHAVPLAVLRAKAGAGASRTPFAIVRYQRGRHWRGGRCAA